MFQSLESRTFFAAHALVTVAPGSGGAVTDPTVVADLAKIKTDRTTYYTDLKAAGTLLRADQVALGDAVKTASDGQTALKATLKDDLAKVAADGKAVAVLVKQYAGTFRADLKAIFDADTDAAKAAAKTQLQTDRAALKAALAAPQATLKTDLASVSADRKAIRTAVDADPAVAAALAKLKSDTTAQQTVLKADRTTLAADYKQLATDRDGSDNNTTSA